MLKLSGVVNGVLSYTYVPKRLSFSENLWSTRIVKKFSLTTCCAAKRKTPVSPVPSSGPFGRAKRPKYFCAPGSTVTVVGVQVGGVSGTEQRGPLRAAGDGTGTIEVRPNDCRTPS